MWCRQCVLSECKHTVSLLSRQQFCDRVNVQITVQAIDELNYILCTIERMKPDERSARYCDDHDVETLLNAFKIV